MNRAARIKNRKIRSLAVFCGFFAFLVTFNPLGPNQEGASESASQKIEVVVSRRHEQSNSVERAISYTSGVAGRNDVSPAGSVRNQLRFINERDRMNGLGAYLVI